MGRSKLQREANYLDLDMFRLVGRLYDFSETLPRSKAAAVAEVARYLKASRSLVRGHMNPEDRKATDGSSLSLSSNAKPLKETT